MTDPLQLNTSQEIDAAIRKQMMRHTRDDEDGLCTPCGEIWPCQYIIQGSITLKLSAIAGILSADQAAIIQSIVAKGGGNGQKVERR